MHRCSQTSRRIGRSCEQMFSKSGPRCRSAVLESERKTNESAAGILRSKRGKFVASGDGGWIRRFNRPWPLSLDAVSRKQVNPAAINRSAGVGLPASNKLPVEFDPGSFRDRSSRVFLREGRVFRAMDAESLATWRRACAQPFLQQMVSQGQIVGTREVPAEECAAFGLPSRTAGVLEHDRIPFISYPYEWSFAMLARRGALAFAVAHGIDSCRPDS